MVPSNRAVRRVVWRFGPRDLLYCLAILAWTLGSTSAADSPIRKSEFLNGSIPTPQCHASTLVETPQGLVAAWFGGTEEKNPDVGIWLTREESGTWTEPVEIANGLQPDGSRFPCWNPVLFLVSSDKLILFYKIGPSPDRWWGMSRVSADCGRTWSDPQRLPEGIIGPIKNKPLRLSTGTILCPSSSEDNGWRVHFERSEDEGKSWIASGPINDGKAIAAIQPSLLVHADGALQAIGRTRQGRLFSTESRDSGMSWSEMKLLSLPNPNSGTDAATLRDGTHVLVYNHTLKGRSPLNVAVSADGREWKAALALETEPGEYSYPAVIQTNDGLIHVTYTWRRRQIRHVVMDPSKWTPRPIEDGVWPPLQ